MSKGFSLHIGINSLSTNSYKSAAELCSPENDARVMASIAEQDGFSNRQLLLGPDATKENFLDHFSKISQLLNPSDTFLITFSGHGGQQADADFDEDDGKDETWCFYNGYLVDDEIGEKWKEFKAGARIIVVSSSCHSRTSLKPWSSKLFGKAFEPEQSTLNPVISYYPKSDAIQASILHISACEDKREARDGDYYSRFTELLVKAWDQGRFTGTYEDMIRAINKESGYLQQSGIAILGNNCPELLNSSPFKLLTHKT